MKLLLKMLQCTSLQLTLNTSTAIFVTAEEVEHERQVLTQQALNEGKPEKIVAKMVEGSLGKFFEEICLLDQAFVKTLI